MFNTQSPFAGKNEDHPVSEEISIDASSNLNDI